MSPLIDQLKKLNRKERFLLLQAAIGEEQFVLGENFRKQVGKAIGLEVPAKAFFAIDYHLDWLYVAIRSCNAAPDTLFADEIGINRNQEDIDLLIAFDQDDVTHLVLIEAKGVTGWGREQIASKLRRLAVIDNVVKTSPCKVRFHLLLTGLYESAKLTQAEIVGLMPDAALPDWAFFNTALRWIKLELPEHVELVAPMRYDTPDKKSKAGTNWKLQTFRLPERLSSDPDHDLHGNTTTQPNADQELAP